VAFDLQGFIDHELALGRKTIVVPPGRYRVQPHHTQHLVLQQLHDVSILADHVELICTETTRALTLNQCTNVVVRGLAIDYDPLPFTQGRITQLSADKKIHDIEVFAGYPDATAVVPFKYEIFRPDTRTLRCRDYGYTVEPVDARHFRVVKGRSHADDPEQVGDVVVIATAFAPHGQIPHAVECSHCRSVRLEKVTLYASGFFGFVENDCDGTLYERCAVARRSAADDLVLRASPRVRSLDADAFHSVAATRGPTYLECSAHFMGDDCINIHGFYHMIMASQGHELRVLATRQMNIQAGDPVEVTCYGGVRLPDARVVTVKPDGGIREDERAFLLKQHLHKPFRTNAHDVLGKAYLITLDRAVDVPRGSVVAAMNRVGNGFLVKGCDFGDNRSRGILVKASQGSIIGNRLEGCWMSAILVSPEYWWLEAGDSSDVEIRNNRITACLDVPIRVESPAGNGAVAPVGAHQNIVITGNVIKDCAAPGILVTSTKGLHIADNELHLCLATNDVPKSVRTAGGDATTPVVEINCAP